MAVHRENIVISALHTLVVAGIDMGATFAPLVLSTNIETEEIGNEISRTPIDAEITRRAFSAEVTLAEVKLLHLAIILNLPTANIVSSSSMLALDSDDRDSFELLAVGKNGSAPNGGTRTFNFPRARSVGTPTYNLAKLEATGMPAEFNFYADRTTAEVGTITDTQENFMLFDTAMSSVMPLDGLPTVEPVYTSVNQLRIVLIRVVYTETTSAHAGVVIRVGKIGAPSYYGVVTSEAGKQPGEITEMTILQELFAAEETMIVTCDGLKTGGGAARVQIELEGWV